MLLSLRVHAQSEITSRCWLHFPTIVASRLSLVALPALMGSAHCCVLTAERLDYRCKCLLLHACTQAAGQLCRWMCELLGYRRPRWQRPSFLGEQCTQCATSSRSPRWNPLCSQFERSGCRSFTNVYASVWSRTAAELCRWMCGRWGFPRLKWQRQSHPDGQCIQCVSSSRSPGRSPQLSQSGRSGP
jgi:hypothetical protein